MFDKTSSLTLLGEPVSMHLCVADLDKVGGKLVARIAAATDERGHPGGAGRAAERRRRPDSRPRTSCVLDAQPIAQLLFASWRDGGLTRPAPDVDASIFYALVPALADHYTAATAQVSIDAELPPLVHATPMAAGNLTIELGDVMVDISLQGDRVLRFDVGLVLQLQLVPVDGKLSPMVVDTEATVALVDARYDGPGDALEQAVQAKIGATAASLLGDAAAIALPDLPGLGTPVKVTADKGGRFLHIALH